MKVQVEFIQSLYPYSAGDIGFIRKDQAERYEKAGTVKIVRQNKSMADRVEVETKSKTPKPKKK